MIEIASVLLVLFAGMFAGCVIGWIARGYFDNPIIQIEKEIAYGDGKIDGYLEAVEMLDEARRQVEQQ